MTGVFPQLILKELVRDLNGKLGQSLGFQTRRPPPLAEMGAKRPADGMAGLVAGLLLAVEHKKRTSLTPLTVPLLATHR
jgi:hypothetical protein